MVNGGGGGGGLVMVTDSPADSGLVFPATSRVCDVKRYGPLGRAEAVMVHTPLLACPVPKTVLLANRSMVVLFGPVPVKVGVLSEVMLSVLLVPVSEEASR